jgi:hypothetical protein
MLALSTIRSPSINLERRRLIRDIKRSVTPYLWDSGYVTRKDPRKCRFAEGNRRPLRVWYPLKNGKLTDKKWKLRGTYVLGEIEGLSEGGVVTDCGVGAIVTTGYDELPLEDLLRLMDWVRLTFLPLAQAQAEVSTQAKAA